MYTCSSRFSFILSQSEGLHDWCLYGNSMGFYERALMICSQGSYPIANKDVQGSETRPSQLSAPTHQLFHFTSLLGLLGGSFGLGMLEVLIQSQMLSNSPALAPFWVLFVCFSWFIKRMPIVLLWRGSSILGGGVTVQDHDQTSDP